MTAASLFISFGGIFGINEYTVLFVTGVIGGILSGLVGNGIDIVTFSVMVLLFKISEKVATPTSVILMAFNAIVGFLLYFFITYHTTEP